MQHTVFLHHAVSGMCVCFEVKQIHYTSSHNQHFFPHHSSLAFVTHLNYFVQKKSRMMHQALLMQEAPQNIQKILAMSNLLPSSPPPP